MDLKDRIKIIKRNKIHDTRGWFLKVITGNEDNLPNFTGEIYVVSAIEGESRANHYHIKANEWFCLVQGEVQMYVEDIKTKERISITLNADSPVSVYVPNNVAHSFNNISNIPFILITYTDKLYVPEDTVSYPF